MIKKENISKQFATWATNFKHNPFLKARLKLTFFYTVGVMVILVVFSLAVYGLFTRNITNNLEYEGPRDEESANIEIQLIDKAQDRLQSIILTVNGLIIILVAGLSYYLAGKTLKPIEVAYARQKKFVADSAHELRTPLAVMKIGAETILIAEASKEDYKKLIKDFLEELNYLSLMVNDLLFLARSDDLKKIEFTKLDLGSLFSKQIKLMQPYAKSKDVTLRDDIQGEFYINGNKDYLKRLLANLIKNAIDYNKPKGEVIISLQKNKQQIEFKIIDTGIGMAKEDLEHIFDRFYKADQSRTKTAGGAGLGLSIVREIVKAHKGNIKVKSEIDKGTVIIISFPLS